MKNTIELHKRWKDDPSKGEVFTPIEIVKEMLDRIPLSVWENPTSTFLDPCMGKGTFLVEIVNRLVYIYGYSKEDAISRVYGYDIRVKYVNYLKRGGFINVFHKDFLNEVFNMKFDVVLGNPPYQEVDGQNKSKRGGNNLYIKFIKKSYELSEYLLFITPQSWMAPGNQNSVNKFFFRDYFLKNTLLFVESGWSEKFFNVGSKFSIFLLRKGRYDTSVSLRTKINELVVDTKIDMEKIRKMKFLPTLPNSECLSIFDKCIFSTTEKLKFVFDLTYDIRRQKDIREETDTYIYPIYNTGKQIRYSTFKSKNFDESKVIISLSGHLNPIYDEGNFGTSNNTMHLVTTDGDHYKFLLNSKLFTFLLKYSKYSGFYTKEVLWSLPKVPTTILNDQDLYEYFNLTDEEINLIECI